MKYTGRRENDFSVDAYVDRDVDVLQHRRQPGAVAERRVPELDLAARLATGGLHHLDALSSHLVHDYAYKMQ